MNLDYTQLLDKSFHPASRVWIYQCSRLFTLHEALAIEDLLSAFSKQWKTHGTPVAGAGYLFFGQFIVLMADETTAGVSGCSTDSSVRFIKEIESTFNVSLFDRNNLAFVIRDKIELLPLTHLSYSFENGFLTPETLYFNNTVLTKADLETRWIIPLRESWLAKRIPALRPA